MAKKQTKGEDGKAEEAGRAAKVITASFTIPADEHRAATELITRLLKRQKVVSRSELVRAGLVLLRRLSDKQLMELIESLPKVRPGRPFK